MQIACALWDLKINRKHQVCHTLMLGNWDITSLTRKRYKLVEEAKRYFLDIAVTSSTKRQGLSTMQLSNA